MNAVQRNVCEINAQERQVLESVLGQPLRDSQQVVIRVLELNKVPDEQTRLNAMNEACEIAARGRANAAAQGVTEEEVDAAIEEALKWVRSTRN
ncbi:MAG: hypothetical protein WD851_13620 [Pirellulales bacterium]